jgi:hypothetical protein
MSGDFEVKFFGTFAVISRVGFSELVKILYEKVLESVRVDLRFTSFG